jgi:hypothetical protein
MKNNRKNQQTRKNNGRKNGPVAVRPLVAELAQCEKEGLPKGDSFSGFGKGLNIHDQTRQRTITNQGRMPSVHGKNGKRMDFECYVKRRNSAGPTEMTLSLRAIAPVIDKEQMINILSNSPSMVANPEECLATMRQLMEDGMITMDIIDDVLDIHHPAWSQLDWKIDETLEQDYITGFLANPENSNKTEADALEAFNAQANVVFRKEGTVEVSIETDKGTKKFKMHIAAEKAQLDKGRYFLALAKDCSPFRIAWLKIHGFKHGQRQIEGRAKDHRTVGKITPSFVKEEKSRSRNTLGDAIKVANPEVGGDLLSALRSGETITF